MDTNGTETLIPDQPDIPGHRIDRLLGKGGMGEVYLARDVTLGRRVAVKLIKASVISSETAKMRFLREARMMAAVEHAHIVRVYAFGESAGGLYLVMEYVEGADLRERIQRTGRLAVPEALRILEQTVEALEAAWERSIVHRDVKPSNILIDTRDQVRVADFGLAKSNDSAQDASITHRGHLVGTPVYISPERARGEESSDFRADIYSLGIVLYQMLTGEPPFAGQNPLEIIGRHLHHELPSLSSRLPDTAVEIERLYEWMTSMDPDDRPASYAELKQRIRVLRAGSDTLTVGSAAKVSRVALRRPALVIGGVLAALAVVLAVVTNQGILPESLRRTPASSRIGSLAVLPFSNLSEDRTQDWFADSMTGQMINTLGGIRELRVAGRRSSMAFKNTSLPVTEIARQLGVQVLLEGSVVLAEGQVRITAELIEPATGAQIWTDTYHDDFEELITLQREVATAIADEIQVTLTPEERAQLRPVRRGDPRAQELYLRGRQLVDLPTPDEWHRAVELFRQAIEIDSRSAPAHAGLARAYGRLISQDRISRTEHIPLIRAEVERALQLDDGLAEAHREKGRILLFLDWDWSGAATAFERSLALNPNSADTRMALAWYLLILGRTEDALAEMAHARSIEPMAGVTTMNVTVLWLTRRYDEALELIESAIEFTPDNPTWYEQRMRVYILQGRFDEALSQYRAALDRGGGEEINVRVSLGYFYALTGREDEARQVLDELLLLRETREFSTSFLAMLATALGDHDRAFDWLKDAFDERRPDVLWFRLHPFFDPLRSDPRHRDLIERIGYPEFEISPS